MSRRTGIYVVLIVVLSLCLSLTGCRQKRPLQGIPSFHHSHMYVNEDQIDDTNDPIITPVITGANYNLVSINYYAVNVTESKVINAVAMEIENTVITPERILGYLIDSLEDESITLSYNSIEMNDGNVTIDFTDTIYPISLSGVDLEYAVLDAAAQSILDNIKDATSVSYHINGNAYKTANLSFGYNDVYMDD